MIKNMSFKGYICNVIVILKLLMRIMFMKDYVLVDIYIDLMYILIKLYGEVGRLIWLKE